MIKRIRQFFRRGWMIRLGSPQAVYRDMLRRIRENEHFSFSRWGDGEWEAALALKAPSEANCDGHQYFESLGTSLAAILRNRPAYLLGMQRLAYHKVMGRQIDRFLKEAGIGGTTLRWIDADVFHEASMRGEITTFFEALAGRKVLLVGPAYLSGLSAFSFDLVDIPPVNVWLEREAVLERIQEALERTRADVVLFCAGMTSNWFIDQLHGRENVSLIDVGSLLDPFAGRQTRRYHKKLGDKYADLNG